MKVESEGFARSKIVKIRPMITNKKAIKKLAIEMANDYENNTKTRVSKDFLKQVDEITYWVTMQMVRSQVADSGMTLKTCDWGDKVVHRGKKLDREEESNA
jgi:hypothetical protein